MLSQNTSIAAARRAQAARKNPRDPHGDPEGIVTDPKALVLNASSVVLAKRIGDLLERKYPGWAWAIEVDERGGVTNIKSLRLSGQWGYRIKTALIQDDPQLKRVLMGAGELLERFRQRRGRYDLDRWREAPRRLGLVDFDISDKAQKVQRRYRDDAFSKAVRSERVKLIVRDTVSPVGTVRQLYLGIPGAHPDTGGSTTRIDLGGVHASRRS